jgi:hypothetical protein
MKSEQMDVSSYQSDFDSGMLRAISWQNKAYKYFALTESMADAVGLSCNISGKRWFTVSRNSTNWTKSEVSP